MFAYAQLKERGAPQLQNYWLKKFELLSSGDPVNQAEELDGNFNVLQQQLGKS